MTESSLYCLTWRLMNPAIAHRSRSAESWLPVPGCLFPVACSRLPVPLVACSPGCLFPWLPDPPVARLPASSCLPFRATKISHALNHKRQLGTHSPLSTGRLPQCSRNQPWHGSAVPRPALARGQAAAWRPPGPSRPRTPPPRPRRPGRPAPAAAVGDHPRKRPAEVGGGCQDQAQARPWRRRTRPQKSHAGALSKRGPPF